MPALVSEPEQNNEHKTTLAGAIQMHCLQLGHKHNTVGTYNKAGLLMQLLNVFGTIN